MQTLDEKFSGPDLFPDVILDLGGILALRHQILIDVADAQMGNVFVVGGHHEIVAGALNENLGQDVLIGIGQKSAAGSRLEPGDARQSFLDFFDVAAGAAGNFRDAPFAQRFHVVAHDLVFE